MDLESASKNIASTSRKPYLWARVLLWCGTIYILSSIPSAGGRTLKFDTALDILDFLLRKGAHFLEYLILMVFTYRAFQGPGAGTRDGHLLKCFLFVLAFAVSDEWHQHFVPGRSGSGFDVFIDCLGAFAAYVFIFQNDQKNHEKEIANQSPPRLEN